MTGGKPSRMRVTFVAQLAAGMKHDAEANVYVTWVPTLNIYSQGTTKVRATRALRSAIGMFLEVAHAKGALEEVFTMSGLEQADGPMGPEDEFIAVHEELLDREGFEESFSLDVPYSVGIAA